MGLKLHIGETLPRHGGKPCLGLQHHAQFSNSARPINDNIYEIYLWGHLGSEKASHKQRPSHPPASCHSSS